MALTLNRTTVNTPPRAAASVILLRDAKRDSASRRGGFEVLLQRRDSASALLGGAHVFPGGKVDPGDADPALAQRLDQTPAALHAALGEPDLSPEQAMAVFVAAIRELHEEAGVLIADADPDTVPPPPPKAASFPAWVAEAGLRLHTSRLVPWSRWITPTQPSVMNRRFDTRFFITRIEESVEVRHDGFEAVESLWMTPAEALERYWSRDLILPGPQLMSIGHLTRFDSIDAVMADAKAWGIRLVEPHVCEIDGERVTCYPGDPLHPRRDVVVPGPSRLAFRDGRFEPEGGLAAWFGG